MKTGEDKEWNLAPAFREFQKKITPEEFPEMSRDNPDEGKYEDSFRKKLRDGVKALKRENCELEELESWIKKEQSGSDEPSSRIKKYKELCTYFERYEKFMKERGKIDFEDMVKNAITKLSKKGNESVLLIQQVFVSKVSVFLLRAHVSLSFTLGSLITCTGL